MKKYELIIFDCDGTLVNSEPISNQVVAEMMTDIGINMTKEMSIELFAGKKFSDIEAHIKNHGIDPEDIGFEKAFRKNSKLAFEKFLEPMPGVIEFIESTDCKICVASNGPQQKMDITPFCNRIR